MITNEANSSLNAPTLEHVKAQFAQWRATRVKGNRIPRSLWNVVESLTKSYNYKQIASELKISPGRLSKKMKNLFPQDSSLPPSSHFVEVTLPAFASASPKAYIHTGFIELTRGVKSDLKVHQMAE